MGRQRIGDYAVSSLPISHPSPNLTGLVEFLDRPETGKAVWGSENDMKILKDLRTVGLFDITWRKTWNLRPRNYIHLSRRIPNPLSLASPLLSSSCHRLAHFFNHYYSFSVQFTILLLYSAIPRTAHGTPNVASLSQTRQAIKV